jgi:uncharacterized membrane protein (UPF0182 family)
VERLMFSTSYLLIALVAAIPLARTFLSTQGGNQIAFLHRLYRDAAYVLAAVLGVICFESALRISLENYWFTELGQEHRYWLSLEYRLGIFLVVFVSVGLFVGSNLGLLSRRLPPIPRSAPWLAAFLVSGVAALFATPLWIPVIRFFGASPTGTTDPVFGKDLSFYLFGLPLYDDVVGGLIAIVLFAIVAWAAAGIATFQRPDEFSNLLLESHSPRFAHRQMAASGTNRAIGAGWLQQGLGLAMLLCLLLGVSRFLSRYHLVIDGHSKVVAGASYADAHYWIPAYDLLVGCWFAAAGILALAALAPRFRSWLLLRRSRWVPVCAVLAVLYLGAFAVPAGLEDLYVGPNQITLEQPYLLRSIAGTRQAYNLEGPGVEEREFVVSDKALTREDLDRDASTLRDARIWDWRALEPQLQQIQGLRPYYTFAGVDIDRYTIDGVDRQVMITARELAVERLPDQAKVWVNLALKYTHGYGAVVVSVNEIDSRGNPLLWAHDIPLQAKQGLAVDHGQIYYGELTRERVYVHTTEKEFDFPQGQANVEATYAGKGGVWLSNFWRKLVIAHEFDGLRLFISEYFTPESRVMLRRNIFERVQTLAPFLTFDRDPYIVADGDHYSFILDGYTTSETYPYSEPYRGSLPAFHGRNYLRNSVKAVIDAYNGSVTFYVFDQRDPIIKAYERMLPDFFTDAGEMPANLRQHIRYPEDIFTVQAEMYGTYHMTNPTTFYNREDRWEVPHELFRDREIEVLPYYVTTQLPNAQKPEFLLMLPMSVAGKNQMAGWLAGLSDGENYGKLVAFRFPKGTFIDGPAQVESRISSDSRFSGDLTLWDQHGSHVIRGNLIVFPLSGNQLVALEPVYIEAEQTRMPTLARVVLGQLLPDDRKIEWASTLTDAENLLVGAPLQSAAPAAASRTGTTEDRLDQAGTLFREMQEQYAAGNFSRYGELLQELGKLLAPP